MYNGRQLLASIAATRIASEMVKFINESAEVMLCTRLHNILHTLQFDFISFDLIWLYSHSHSIWFCCSSIFVFALSLSLSRSEFWPYFFVCSLVSTLPDCFYFFCCCLFHFYCNLFFIAWCFVYFDFIDVFVSVCVCVCCPHDGNIDSFYGLFVRFSLVHDWQRDETHHV